MKSTLIRFLGFVAALALCACAGEDDDAHEEHEAEEDPGEHACEAVEEGGALALEGATDRADAPLLEQGEEAYEVSLAADAPRYVRVHGPGEGLLFAATADVVTGLYHEDDTENLLPDRAPNELCESDIPEHFDLDLDAADYYIELSPSAASEVWLLFTAAEGHAHEE